MVYSSRQHVFSQANLAVYLADLETLRTRGRKRLVGYISTIFGSLAAKGRSSSTRVQQIAALDTP